MINVYLFDWGDTLMIDYPNEAGKMCDWPVVEAVAGAKETLAALSLHAKIYVATGAADSTEMEIKSAFERVGLSEFISGYFCKANVGLSKGSVDFMLAIIATLNQPVTDIAMIGDNYEKDIEPALAAGINPVWLSNNDHASAPKGVKIINELTELIEKT